MKKPRKKFTRESAQLGAILIIAFGSTVASADSSTIYMETANSIGQHTARQAASAKNEFTHFIVGRNRFRISCDYHSLLYYKGRRPGKCGNEKNSPITTNLVSIDTRFYQARRIKEQIVDAWIEDLYPSLVYMYEADPHAADAEAFSQLKQQHSLPQPLSKLPRQGDFFVFSLGPNNAGRYFIAATKEGLTPGGLPLTIRCSGEGPCRTRYVLESSVPIRYRFFKKRAAPIEDWLPFDRKVRAFVQHLYLGPVK